MAQDPRRARPTRSDREAIAGRLHSVTIHLLRRVRKDDPQSGLSPARASLLSVVVFGGPRTMGQLAAAEQVTPATISRLVDGLVADGFVQRKPDAKDGRIINVTATKKARDRLAQARLRRIEYLTGMLEHIPPQSWQILAQAVELLETAVRK